MRENSVVQHSRHKFSLRAKDLLHEGQWWHLQPLWQPGGNDCIHAFCSWLCSHRKRVWGVPDQPWSLHCSLLNLIDAVCDTNPEGNLKVQIHTRRGSGPQTPPPITKKDLNKLLANTDNKKKLFSFIDDQLPQAPQKRIISPNNKYWEHCIQPA